VLTNKIQENNKRNPNQHEEPRAKKNYFSKPFLKTKIGNIILTYIV
jgi:hypothetical protein